MDRSPSWREAVLVGAAATLASLLLYGFHGARWVDAPIIRSFVDPSLYANDPFRTPFHTATPAAIPHRLFALVVGVVSPSTLDAGLLLIYLPTTLTALALVYALATRLFGRRDTALIALVLYLAGTRLVSIGSPTLHSAEMTPQVLAFPLQLGAIYAMVVRRATLAGLLLGLAFNLHVPLSAQLGFVFGMWLLVSWRTLGPAGVLRAALVAGLVAAPSLVGILAQHTRPLEPWEIELQKAVTGSDLSVARSFESRAQGLANVLGIAFLALLVARVRPREGATLVNTLLAGAALLLVSSWLAVDVLGWPAIATPSIRANLARVSWMPNLMGVLLLAEYVRRGWQVNWPPRLLLLLLIGAALAAPSASLPLEPLWYAAIALVLACEAVGWLRPAPAAWFGWLVSAAAVLLWLAAVALGLRGTALGNAIDFRLSLAAGGFAALTGAVLVVSALTARRLAAPWWARTALFAVALIGVAIARNLETWLNPLAAGDVPAEQVIAWAATTPPGSIFLVPPNDPFSLEFLRRSGRPVFLVREGANHGLYFPEVNREFARRLRALGIDDPLDFRAELDAAYEDLSADDVRAIAREFGVRYFIRPPGSRYPFPSALRVEGYVVYQVEP